MKKIVIIGGGVAGLSAGIFAQKNGFDSVILEKHHTLGGECTGWDRQGYHIDGCIHWLVGTKEGTPLRDLWNTVCALDGVEIYHPESFMAVEHEDVTVHFYRDIERLKSSWLDISPEDKDIIEEFCKDIKKPVILEVTEQNNPAKIIIDAREDEEAEKLPAVYSLRTASFPLGEGIAAAEGILKWELASANARLLRDTDGTYFVEEGYYLTEEEALARLSEVEEYEYFDFKMFIEKREPHQTPKSIAE